MRRIQLATVAAAVSLALPAAARAYSNAGRPLAAAGQDAGDVQVFWRGGAGNLIEAQEINGNWGAATTTPVSGLATDPAAVSVADGDDVFYQGTNGHLWEAAQTGGSWSAPVDLGMGQLGSQPAATTFSSFPGVTEIDVFWQGTDNDLWNATWESSTNQWQGPANHHFGPLNSAPTVTSYGDAQDGGQILAFWFNTGAGLEEAYDNFPGSGAAGTWNGPGDTGIKSLGGPPSAAYSNAQQQNYSQDSGTGDLDEATWNGTAGWQGQSLGFGPLGSAPTAVGVSSSDTDVFWETGNQLWEAVNDAGNWSSLESIGSLTPPPAVQSTPQPVTISTAPPTPTTPGTKSTPENPALHVKITFRATWNLDRTRIRDLTFSKLPTHSGIRITCTGKGCPKNLGLTTAKYTLATLIRHFDTDTFRVGQTITITVGHTGYTAQKVRLTIRRGAEPAARLL